MFKKIESLNYYKEILCKSIATQFILISIFCCLQSITLEVPAFSQSLITLDLELDDDIDIAIGHSVSFNSGLIDTLTIMINDGDFGFEQIHIEDIYRNDALCSADFNNDGYQDIVSAAFNGFIRIYFNNACGGFEERIIIDSDIGATMLRAVDVDNDGDKDIIYFNNNYMYGEYFGVLSNSGSGYFTNTHHNINYGSTDQFTVVSDINNDNLIDICTGLSIFMNTGDDYELFDLFSFPSDVFVNSTAFGYFNNDNYLDQYCTDYQGVLHFRIQEDFMEFTPLLNFSEIPNNGWLSTKIYTQDLNNDGYDDLIYSEQINNIINLSDFYIHVLINNESSDFFSHSYFVDHTSKNQTSEILHFDDLNDDGYKDIIMFGIFPTADVCQELIDHVVLLFNEGDGNFTFENPVSNELDSQDDSLCFSLSNFPNPFSKKTKISFDLPFRKEKSLLEIYNLRGQKINSFNCEGLDFIVWDGKDYNQRDVSSGIYLCKIISNNMSHSKKMILIK